MKPTQDMIDAGRMALGCFSLTDSDVITIWEAMQRHAPAQPPACWCGKNRDEAEPPAQIEPQSTTGENDATQRMEHDQSHCRVPVAGASAQSAQLTTHAEPPDDAIRAGWKRDGLGGFTVNDYERSAFRTGANAALGRAAAPVACNCGARHTSWCASVHPRVAPLVEPLPPAQAEPQPEAIPIAPVEVVRQALKELLESISECRMDQVTARFAKASVMARAVVDRYKDET